MRRCFPALDEEILKLGAAGQPGNQPTGLLAAPGPGFGRVGGIAERMATGFFSPAGAALLRVPLAPTARI